MLRAAQARCADRRGCGGADGDRLSASPPVAERIQFLAAHPPFDALAPEQLSRVAEALEVEGFAAGASIFPEGAGPVAHLRVIRSGAVEIVHEGRVLDLLGEGELFGHASMLSGLPTGFAARAAQDTVCWRLEADVARSLLGEPAGLRFVARSLLQATGGLQEPVHDAAQRPAASLIRAAPIVCAPDTSIREAARRMSHAGATAAMVKLSDGSFGIVTDRDLRSRVVAGGVPGDAPVSAVMSAPAYTCAPERLGGDVLLDMLDRGFRHYPVVSATGQVLGVIEDLDVLAAHARSSLVVRQRIAQAQSLEALAAAAAELGPMMVAMYDGRVAATNAMAMLAVVVDALTRRLLELTVARAGRPPVEFAWLALGSHARREALPSSDLDSAIAWFGEFPEREAKSTLDALGKRVVSGLEACGLPADTHGASAADPRFVRSLPSWQRLIRGWIEDPTQDNALILTSVLVDSRPVWGIHTGTPVADGFAVAPGNPALLRMLARFALSHRPPTGFLRGLVVEHTGEHRGRLDLKGGGTLPIVDLARWAGIAAGVTSASTLARLRAAGDAGTLSGADASTLEDAFELICTLRLEHQVAQLREGLAPDNHVDPARLSRLTRTHLREAFRAVASIQKRVAGELQVMP